MRDERKKKFFSSQQSHFNFIEKLSAVGAIKCQQEKNRIIKRQASKKTIKMDLKKEENKRQNYFPFVEVDRAVVMIGGKGHSLL